MMVRDTGKRHLPWFAEADGETEKYHSSDDVPLTVMVPAFIISELRTAFSIGLFRVFYPLFDH